MNRFFIFFSLIITLGILTGCGKKEEEKKPSQDTLTVHNRPEDNYAIASMYEGVLPCADCPGIRTRLIIYADSVNYKLEETYLDSPNDTVYTSYGKWTISIGTEEFSEAEVYHLQPENPDVSRDFRVVNEDTLIQLDKTLHEINSKLNWKLARVYNAEESDGR